MCAAITADRGFTWSDEETSLLLQLWGGNDAQSELTGNKRNFVVYGKISETMNEMGYFRTASQCREKIKRMKREYTLTKQHNESGVGNKKNMRFYEQFEKILLEKQKRNLKNTTLKPCSSKEMEPEINESEKKCAAARYDRKQRKLPSKSKFSERERIVKELCEPSEKELDTPWTPDVLLVEDTPNPLLMDNQSIASTSSVNGSKTRKGHIAAYKYRKTTHSSASKVLKMANLKKTKGIRKLREKNTRIKKKTLSFETIFNDLEEKGLIDEWSKNILELSLGDVTEIMMKQLQEQRSRAFPLQLKPFVLTLYFYSAKAYDYVRKSFDYPLPHPVVLRKWYYSIEGSPGFSTTALNACQQKVSEASVTGKTVQCALIVDEMPIRDAVEWDGHQFIGRVDYGTGVEDNDMIPDARDAYTFMLNSINDNWKVPVAYFFINNLSAMTRANLISLCLRIVHKTGVEVVSVTFWADMQQTVKCLCGDAKVFNYMRPHFKHPVTGNLVSIVIDPSHLMERMMHTLASHGFFLDNQGRVIKWEHFVALEKLQKYKGLLLATKIRKRHVEWDRNKINLASQVFSLSIVDALSYLSYEANIPEFKNCDATIEFIKCFNTLFDIFYSKNCFSKGLKAPLCQSNKNHVWEYLDFAEKYIKSLQTPDGILLVNSSMRTSVLGFLTCIYSIKELYHNLIETKKLEYICMYKFSLDNLKMFFGAIRSRSGINDNEPTCKLFSEAYKNLVCLKDVCSMSNIYCTQSDHTKKSNISTSVNYYSHSLNKSHPFSIVVAEDVDNAVDLTNFLKLKPIVGDIIIYVAGFVVKKVIKSIQCSTCIKALLHNEKRCNITNSENGGGLIEPGRDVIHLCRVAERIVRVFKLEKTLNMPIIIERIITHSMRGMFSTTFSCLNKHILSQDALENHKILLIKSVLFEFLKIRLNQMYSRYEFESLENFETIKLRLKKYWANVLKNDMSF